VKNIAPKDIDVNFQIGKLYQNLTHLDTVIYSEPPNKINLIPNTQYDPNVTLLGSKIGILFKEDVFLLLETKRYSKQHTDLMYCKILKEDSVGWVLIDLDNLSMLSE